MSTELAETQVDSHLVHEYAFRWEAAGFVSMNPTPPYTRWIEAAVKVATAEECDRILEPLAAAQVLLADAGAGGRFVWAKGAGHEIHLTKPKLIYDTSDEVWIEALGAR